PFDRTEGARFARSTTRARLRLLRWAQARSFKRSAGTIFLTKYAFKEVASVARLGAGNFCIIPHGVDERFRRPPRAPSTSSPAAEQSLRVLYVSIVNRYKHQWHVAEAVAALRAEGVPVSLELVGPAEPASLERLNRTLASLDPRREHIRYVGPCKFDE